MIPVEGNGSKRASHLWVGLRRDGGFELWVQELRVLHLQVIACLKNTVRFGVGLGQETCPLEDGNSMEVFMSPTGARFRFE